MSRIKRIKNLTDALFIKKESHLLVAPHGTGLEQLLSDFEKKAQMFIVDMKGNNHRFAITTDIEGESSDENFWNRLKTNKLIVLLNYQLAPKVGLWKLQNSKGKEAVMLLVLSSKLDYMWDIRKNSPIDHFGPTHFLLPSTYNDLIKGTIVEKTYLENLVLFGSYPAVLNNRENQTLELNKLINEEILKDISLIFPSSTQPISFLMKLLKYLAVNIGKQISFQEITTYFLTENGITIGESTLNSYINILVEVGVIFKIRSESIDKGDMQMGVRYYFLDTGIRNALLGDYRPMNLREDANVLWENFCIADLFKSCINSEFLHTDVSIHFSWKFHKGNPIKFFDHQSAKCYSFSWVPQIFNEIQDIDEKCIVMNSENFHNFVMNSYSPNILSEF